MRLDYGTQISPIPITLSVGEINKPTLREISKITFDKFSYYQFLIRMTPEIFYTNLKKENGGQEYWNSLAKEEKDKITIYDIICKDEISVIERLLNNLYKIPNIPIVILDTGSTDGTVEKIEEFIKNLKLSNKKFRNTNYFSV